MASASKPKLYYFNIQGRAEPIRLALAAAGVEWENVVVDKAEMKADEEHYPFGQVPRYVDDEVDMVQSMGILRHVARKHGLYGLNASEHARVEEVTEGVVDLILKLVTECVMPMKGDKGAKEAYWSARVDAASANSPTAYGAHMAFLDRLLGRSAAGFFCGSGLTVADLMATVTMQLHLEVFDRERLVAQWPALMALHDSVLALPRVRAYLEGPLHPARMTFMM